MSELLVVMFDEEPNVDGLSGALRELYEDQAVILDHGAGLSPVETGRSAQPGRLRRMIGLSRRATSATLTGVLTGMAWAALIFGTVSGELAQRFGGEGISGPALAGAQDVLLLLVEDGAVDQVMRRLEHSNGRVSRVELSGE